MTSDIASLQDIHSIITQFYEKLLNDATMSPFFETFVRQNKLEHHLEIIAHFWHDILFETQMYHENVMQKHLQQNALIRFEKAHFERWTSYFLGTIDASFEGPQATKMKQRALSIATVMQLKMHHSS
ncbi:group III truncated hemoglobin [Polaribacter sp.]|uniref:group III truncated hemoglobin n=1 Tax=Polaribacter sp. TaxID=1920175 RepID=UPI004047F18E